MPSVAAGSRSGQVRAQVRVRGARDVSAVVLFQAPRFVIQLESTVDCSPGWIRRVGRKRRRVNKRRKRQLPSRIMRLRFRLVRASLIIAALLAPVSAWAADAAARVEALRVSAAGSRSVLSEDIWKTAPLVSDFVQREPKEGAEPSQATEFRVAFDSTTLYVKVRAYDREPQQDRHVPHASRRRLAVRLDSYLHRFVPRSAHRVRICREPGRRQTGSLLVQRHEQRQELGCRVGRRRLARSARLDR